MRREIALIFLRLTILVLAAIASVTSFIYRVFDSEPMSAPLFWSYVAILSLCIYLIILNVTRS